MKSHVSCQYLSHDDMSLFRPKTKAKRGRVAVSTLRVKAPTLIRQCHALGIDLLNHAQCQRQGKVKPVISLWLFLHVDFTSEAALM